MGKYDGLAKIIIQNVGGKENISSVTHCVTRLRFKLKDKDKANTEMLKGTEGVVTVMQSAGQYQVVIGNHVPDVYETVANLIGMQTGDMEESGEKLSLGAAMIDAISGIFQPILGVLGAVGILKGVLALLVFLGRMDGEGATYQLLFSIADGFFYFLPIALAYTASKKFKGNQFIGLAIASALCYPAMVGLQSAEAIGVLFAGTMFEMPYQSTFLGLPVTIPQSGYPSSVIPIIGAVYVSSKIERMWKKVIPDVIKTFIVPLLTLLVIVPLTFLVIGPVMSFVSSLISALFVILFNFNGAFAGFFLGAVWQLLVIFGLHWAIVPMAIVESGFQGWTMILSPIFAASFAQIAVVLAIFFKTKDKNLKALSIPAVISGIFGVTEPAIYGITLPKKKPFIISCIGAAVGGGIIGFAGAAQYAIGALGIFSLPSFINLETNDLDGVVWVVIATIIAMGVSFVLTLITYKDEDVVAGKTENISVEPTDTKEGKAKITAKLSTPLVGKVVALEEVPDDAFASGALGAGVAIDPSEGKVYAPCDGKISLVFNTKHAIGIESTNGAEILIHIGINTVNLEGQHFDVKVEAGDVIKKGQLIATFDVEAIKGAGYSLITPILITNMEECGQINVVAKAEAKANVGAELIEIV